MEAKGRGVLDTRVRGYDGRARSGRSIAMTMPRHSPDIHPSRSTERLQYPLFGFWRLGIISEFRLIFVRLREHLQQFLEGRGVIAVYGGVDDRLDPVVPWYERGSDRAYRRRSFGCRLRLVADAFPP